MEKLVALIAKYPRWIALIAGGVSATGFAPLNLWSLTLLCLALLMHLVASANSGKCAFLIGWLFGVGHFSVGNNWIATAFTYQAAMPAWLGWIAVLLLALYLAVYPALACWGAWWITKLFSKQKIRHSREGGSPTPDMSSKPNGQEMGSRLRGNDENSGNGNGLSFILAFAGFWIITEWLRSWVFTGFPWNPLSVVMLKDFDVPLMIRWIGTFGASGVVVIITGGFVWTWRFLSVDSRHTTQWGLGQRFLTWAFLPVLWLTPISLLDGLSNDNDYLRTGRTTTLTVVQPNISQLDKHTADYEAVNFVRLAQNSRPSGNNPRLVFWPESATPWWLEDGYPRQAYFNQPGGTAVGTRQTLAKLLGPNDLLLTGGDRLEFGPEGKVTGARNSVLVMDAQGDILDTYDKAHLVPYGEYLALRWLLEPLGATRLVPGALDFWPGPGPRTLDLPFDGKRIKVGMQICYEIIFSGQVVDRAHRPDFIFQPSNDAWYGSWSRPQFLAQAQLRAIEEGLPVIRATPTGISAVIDADGRIVESLPSGKAGRIDTFLPPAKAPTLFARYGNILPLGFAALLIALAFLPLVRRRISR
jgi:apolipoprotein N-acyltransferase